MKHLRSWCVWMTVSFFACGTVSAGLVADNLASPKHYQKTTSYPKYASVSFLQSDSKLDFKSEKVDVKTQCASMGYVIPVSACQDKMKPSKLCSAEGSMSGVSGADGYTTGCCNSKIYTVSSTDACDNNSTAQVSDSCYFADGGLKYRCSCDRSRYPYSSIASKNNEKELEGCGNNAVFNVKNTCQAYEPKTQKIETYYSGCCPKSYVECGIGNTHTVGVGAACYIRNGDKGIVPTYASCACPAHFDTICNKSMLINSEYYCELDGKILTTDSNCESNCTKTSETNVDDYLYGATWHCLYEPEGATLKPTAEEIKGNLCYGYVLSGVNSGTPSDMALSECEAQGYIKSEADCLNASTKVRCPTNDQKFWCLESRYCTNYNVSGEACVNKKAWASGSTDIQELKSKGAKVDLCLDLSQGIRCKYQLDDCNKGWSDGEFTGNGWVNLDDSFLGDTEKCCNRGYRMDNTTHQCVENVCDKTRFPYAQDPGEDAGTLEICHEADSSASLGYKSYFGYSKCNDDASQGELWIADPSNNRRCICARNGEGGRDYYLPFTTATFYNTNGDESDNYANMGFNAGVYGRSQSCTDADGSYYGYTMCYMGRRMGTDDANKAMCLVEPPTGYTRYYGYYPGISALNEFLENNGLATVSAKPEPRTSANSYCVHKYTHCLSQEGKKLGDDAVCALVPEGCNEGIEAACNKCRHVASVVKGSDGLYHIRPDGMIIELNTCRNNAIYPGISTCPTGFKHGGCGYGICYKYCDLSDLSKCTTPDVLYSGSTRIGVIYIKSGKSLWVAAPLKQNVTWDEAKTYAENYAPEGMETDATFGKGKWTMPQAGTSPYNYPYPYQYRGASCAEEIASGQSWLSNLSENGESAYYGGALYLRSTKLQVTPIVKITY